MHHSLFQSIRRIQEVNEGDHIDQNPWAQEEFQKLLDEEDLR